MTETGGFSSGLPSATHPVHTPETGWGRAPDLDAPESVFQAAWRRFRKNTLAKIGGVTVLVLLFIALLAPFLAPYDHNITRFQMTYVPPQKIYFIDEEGTFHLRPFTYALRPGLDPNTWMRVYEEDRSRRYPIYFFVRGSSYKLFGLIPWDIHLFGTEEGGHLFLLGTDKAGRDLLSRIIYGGQISMNVAVLGALASALLGSAIGAASGYFGGRFDMLAQRVVELLLSFPTLPLFMALSVAIPIEWPPLGVFAGIILIFTVGGWTVLARELRGKVLSFKEEEFVMAARALGAGSFYVIRRHILPNVASHIIVVLTITIPELILAEGALSFLGLGIQPPLVSWGVLLSDATKLETIDSYPWLLIPGVVILLTVLAFNFLGDGLRDAFDARAE